MAQMVSVWPNFQYKITWACKETEMKKALSILLVLLFVVGGGVWYFVTFRMDSMIESQIETLASNSLGTQVSVGEVKTDIKGGTLTISNVTIANPPGFNNENAFNLNGIEAAVDYSNYDIKRVVIDEPEIVIEELGGETNFSRMKAGIEKQGSDPDSDSDPDPAADGKEEPIIVIRHFRMNESRGSFESESLDTYSNLKIDAIELSNIKGTPSEVTNLIATKIINEIAKEAAVELLKAKASEKINSIFGKDKD
jgi:hypothetical protein